ESVCERPSKVNSYIGSSLVFIARR
ncbi:hypothetical protein BMETH_3398176153, partial [methanotrophic bacterial endosymbiont of Bathymodiolus sp.]